ncbi:hypothetical protein GF314_13855, partial [bacterium]|nr:hypothetical protein [bacterium]
DVAVHTLDAPDHAGGWSVDAQVEIPAWDRGGLERLVRYCARPPLAQDGSEVDRAHDVGDGGIGDVQDPEISGDGVGEVALRGDGLDGKVLNGRCRLRIAGVVDAVLARRGGRQGKSDDDGREWDTHRRSSLERAFSREAARELSPGDRV